MDIRIDGDELDRLRRSVAAAPRIIWEELTTGVQRAGLAVQAESQRAARVDTGTMRRSMTTKVEPFSDGVRALVGSNLPYAAVMDRGRAAGGPMPPRGSLLGWMRRHGIDEQAEFVIRRRIARRGIKGDGFLTLTFRRLRPEIGAEMRQVNRRIIARLRSAS